MLVSEMLKELEEKDFPTPVGILTLSKEQVFYNDLQEKYFDIIQQAKKTFITSCKYEPTTEDELSQIRTYFTISTSMIHRELKKDFISLGFYDMDESLIEGIMNDYHIYWRFKAIIASIYDLLGIIHYSSSFRSIFSEDVKRFHDMVGISIEDYIKNTDILEAIHSSFDNITQSICLLFINIIGNRIDLDDLDLTIDNIIGNNEDNDTYHRLLSNILEPAIPLEEKTKIFREILYINPFLYDVYHNMVIVYGDEQKELENLANYLRFNLIPIKQEIASIFFKGLSLDTEKDTLDSKEKLLSCFHHIGLDIENDNGLLQTLDNKLEQFDLMYRTVDGFTCTTRESADFARKELLEITEFMKEVQAPTSKSLLDYEEDLLNKKTLFESRFSSELKPKYLGILEKYLSDFDNKFCTPGLFRKLDRKTAGKERLLKMIKKLDLSTIEKIDEAYQTMEDLLPNLGLTAEDTNDTITYLEKCKDRILNPKEKTNLLDSFSKLFKR